MQLNILVEGQAEEMFVNELLAPYLKNWNINVTAIIVTTKRMPSGLKNRGGLTAHNYSNFISDLARLIPSTPHGLVTTLIDYYAIPELFPGYEQRHAQGKAINGVRFLELELSKSMGSPRNFLPYIQLHEFEAMLFSSKAGFEANLPTSDPALAELSGIVDIYPNPEDINEGPTTAPSKRILHHYPGYNKVVEGNLMLSEIGIPAIKEKCPHFSDWLDKILAFAEAMR